MFNYPIRGWMISMLYSTHARHNFPPFFSCLGCNGATAYPYWTLWPRYARFAISSV